MPAQSTAIKVIFLTLLLDAMGIGLMVPVLPELMVSVLPDTSLAHATLWGGLLSTIFAVMQFLFSPFLGALSDQVGRKPILVITLFFMAVYYLIMALATSIWVLLFGRILGGITAATQSTASAYISDISTPEEKAARFGLIGAAFGLGFVLGPILGGILGEWGARAPFYAAAGLALINMGLSMTALRETVTDDTRKPMTLAQANPFRAIRDMGDFVGLTPLLWVYLIYAIGTAVYGAIWPFFTVERFDWSPGMIGVSLTIYGLSSAIVQGALVRPMTKRFGETQTVTIGLIVEIAALILVAFVLNQWALLALTPIAAFGAIGQPALRSIMSNRVDPKSQGALQGVIGSIMALSMIITPLTMSALFFAVSRPNAAIYFPGFPFLASAVLVCISLWVFAKQSTRK